MRTLNTWGALLTCMLLSTISLAQWTSKVSFLQFENIFNPSLYENLKWRNIGPFRGGRSVAAVGVPNNPMVYYMGSTGGGVWKTTDAGISWNNISDGFFQSGSIGAISVSDSHPNILYVGTGEHAVRGVMTSAGNGIYKSYDGGVNWEHSGLSKSQHIANIQIHPSNPDIVFAAVQGALYGPSSDRGVYKSEDGGKTWRQVLYINPTTGAADLSMDIHNPRVLYAAMWDHQRTPWKVRSGGEGSALYKSSDGGESWTKLTSGLPAEMGKAGIDVSPANSQIVYANIEAKKGGVFRSNDGGKNWEQTSEDRETIARAWYYTKIFADPVDTETVYVLNAPLLKSIDGGRSFKSIRNPHSDQHQLWINPSNPKNMILANDGGACISFNGGQSWSSQENQPTGQFYRVITDHRFPYYVYGGQQDNSTVAIASRTGDNGIDWKDWYKVAGCESAFIAFDPDQPELVYGGCYQGIISVYDEAIKIQKDIMAYPEIGLGSQPKNQRFRFNWNAPIVASPHDPSIVYHAGNVVFRTENEGLSWKAISPDLTRNDTTRQAAGGGPYTNEAAGGEVYNTISYLACSPHSPGVLWVGSDDGLVHLSRNEGRNWENVTPPELGEALINSIEVSPHRPGNAYVVATRYKFNDFTPLIYHTNDYGQHWELITNGITNRHFTRVVREDPQRPGLLYAGTEYGFYVSYTNGKKWEKLQLNLPICPINDLTIEDNDLIAATSGRGFWILDDIGSLQNGLGNLQEGEIHLYPPKPSVRFEISSSEKPVPGIGQNPLNGVIIDYYLAEDMDSTRLELQILDQNGILVRSYSNQTDKDFVQYTGGPAPEGVLPSKKGINRFNWDMRRTPIPGVPQVFIFGDYKGSMAAPGKYQLRFISENDTLEQTFELLPDPRLKVPIKAYQKQQETLLVIEKTVRQIHESINEMRDVQKQVENLNASIEKLGNTGNLIALGEKICKNIQNWESNLIQPKQETYQDVINFPNRLSSEFMNLRAQVDNHDPRVTEGAQERLQDLLRAWQQQQAHMKQILEVELNQYNQTFREKNIPAVVGPKWRVDKP